MQNMQKKNEMATFLLKPVHSKVRETNRNWIHMSGHNLNIVKY